MPNKISVAELTILISKSQGESMTEVETALLTGSLGVNSNDDSSEISKLLDQIEANRRLLKMIRKQLQFYKKNGTIQINKK